MPWPVGRLLLLEPLLAAVPTRGCVRVVGGGVRLRATALRFTLSG